MIQKIRTSRTFKGLSLMVALVMLFEVVQPTVTFALTGGPAQPEFNSFTPIGTSDMVNLSSGDVSYNIPLMDIGGYPINISYDGPPTMDQEASWVGLGWNLSVGQISRNVRGIPDDFNGIDEITYEDHLKPNISVGASFKANLAFFGVKLKDVLPGSNSGINVGMSATYNNYSGFSLKPSVGVTLDLGNAVNVGFQAESGPDGLNLSPSLSISKKMGKNKYRDHSLTANFGVSMNSRQGLSAVTLNMSYKAQENEAQEKERMKVAEEKRRKNYDGGHSIGSSINFANQLYTPTKRVGMETGSFTVNVALGGEIFGTEGQGDITGFGTITKVKEVIKSLPAYGYQNTHLAGEEGVQDINREKDGPVGKNTTNLSLTNHTYDLYSVQGQGVSGQYRPFRNQVGYVHDSKVRDFTLSQTAGVEIGVGNTAHWGMAAEMNTVNSHSGLWSNRNFMLPNLQETGSNYPKDYEKVHFKNVGDLSADEDLSDFMAKTGGYAPIRIGFTDNSGVNFVRNLQSVYRVKSNPNGEETTISGTKVHRSERLKRNQTINNVSIEELRKGVGYGPVAYGELRLLDEENNLRPSHHVGEVQIIRNDGARYIYGYPAYNNVKKEATFSVNSTPNCGTGLIPYSGLDSPESLPNDQYLSRTTTPEYVHTYLLSSVLSTDYVDRTNNGPSADDFGSYTKFTYQKKHNDYKWRVPYQANMATYNEGLKTEQTDDRGNYVYGEKEMVYIQKIETKTHVAVFELEARHDAHGVLGETGGLDKDMNSFSLKTIKLYSVKEYDENHPGTPIKTVHFEYDYSLCKGVPNNDGIGVDNEGGKLTLKKIYFTYRNSSMGRYTPYVFSYSESNPELNPDYNIKAYDSWGYYKAMPNGSNLCANTSPIVPSEFPYTEQDKSIQDKAARAWALDRISLPSGGDISITYESDDYAYVQNKKTMRMFTVVGAGRSNQPSATELMNNQLFSNQPLNQPNTYLYIRLGNDSSLSSNPDDYLKGIKNSPIYFRFLTNMTISGGGDFANPNAKYDYVTAYLNYQEANSPDNIGYNGGPMIFTHSTEKYLSIPIELVKKEGGLIGGSTKVNPISKAAWQFGRKYLNQHVYSNQPNGDTQDAASDITQIVQELVGANVRSGLFEIFSGPNTTLENKNIGRNFIPAKSWVRLSNPNDVKLGGGSRVMQIKMSDAWDEMNLVGNPLEMNYGQTYSYQLENGKTSGVATYEPVGNKDNPFVQPVFSTVNHMLAPNEENFVEKPFGESFFPSPQVTYSRISVSNLQAGTNPDGGLRVKRLHRTGEVVTEFFTSKDYPTIVDQTKMEAREDKLDALSNILNLFVQKHFMATQGYVIHKNDMNGKQKAQWVYAEGQEAPISGVEYLYENHSVPSVFNASSLSGVNNGRLNNNVISISPDGTVGRNTIGVEIDVVNDFRESKTISTVMGVNMNLATFIAGTFPAMVPVPLPDISYSENQLRLATTTKVVNSFGILKETIAYDAGASVSTKNLAWDTSTGEVLLTETVDEFDDKYYTLNYPAHWYYDGMGQASKNIGLQGGISNLGSGSYDVGGFASYMLPGDELNLIKLTSPSGYNNELAWVKSVNGTEIILISESGEQTTFVADFFKIVRSGRRNLQSAGIMNVTLKKNPLEDSSPDGIIDNITDSFLKADNDWSIWEVINSGAVDYSDNWTPPCECDLNTGVGINNPYRINERGIWRTKSSRTYLTGRNFQTNLTNRRQGFFTSFAPMYQMSSQGKWHKDFTDWTHVAEVTKFSPYGFELENEDALERHSAAQYGYNNTFPIAVGANSKYSEIGFDGFEDYKCDGCATDNHFNFRENINLDTHHSDQESHTGRYSLKVGSGQEVIMNKQLNCGNGK